MEMYGSWNIDVAEAGSYERTFRRWPKEANQLSVGAIKKSQAVTVSDKAIRFVVDLPKGKTGLQADFLEKQGQIAWGDYSVDIKKLDVN